MKELLIENLFDLGHTAAAKYLSQFKFPWEALSGIGEYICELAKTLGDDYERLGENVFISRSAKIAPSAYIAGPCIIGPGTEVRHCAFIRANALIGENCVIGNSTELKNVILFDNVQVPHYNYVGDSILGYRAHMGAGSITSNVKSDKTPIVIRANGETIETGRKKFGAALGDFAEIGCSSVLNPGTIIGRGSSVYPLSSVRGVVAEGSIYKSADCIVTRREG